MGRFLEVEELKLVAQKSEELARALLQTCEAYKREDMRSVEAFADVMDDCALRIHAVMENAFNRKELAASGRKW